jgi:hypothetical protein
MSQAAQNIVASPAADKAETIMGAAMTAATARKNPSAKKASKPQSAQAPARRDLAARQVITLASVGMQAPTAEAPSGWSRSRFARTI